MEFIINKFCNIIPFGETFDEFFSVFVRSSSDIVCNSCIQDRVVSVGHDVDEELFMHRKCPIIRLYFDLSGKEIASRWICSQ